MNNFIFLWGYDLHTNSGFGWVLTCLAVGLMGGVILSFFQKNKDK